MDNKSFNLVTDPWLKVIEIQSNQERTVSLTELFENSQNYRQLAGEMHSQDLAILRLLLAILTTVYTRFDTNGELYSWLEKGINELTVDQEMYDDTGQHDLLATWKSLHQAGHFSEIVVQYLEQHQNRFDFFGEQPFYQATTEDYDALVPENKRVAAGKGQVSIKQINRRVSESANTPAIFAPKSGEAKNEIQLDELVRWVIAYQNFTGVTDKTKVVTTEKFSNPAGWLYRLNPVFVKGESLFETLMLNLVLINTRKSDAEYVFQKPVWEYPTVHDYVEMRKKQILPDNLAELYTAWSRLLHIEWRDSGQPAIFSAGIPMFAADSALIEPMTTWRLDKKTNEYRPALKGLQSVGIAMWRNFGQYVKVKQADDIHEPGMVIWLRKLKKEHLIARNAPLILNSIALISDGNATSQSPAVELIDDMQLQADVLFDPEIADYWPTRIEGVIEQTQTVGKDYYHFASDIATIRNVETRPFASALSAKFYDRLNEPFKQWLAGLTGEDDRDEKINLWKDQLKEITTQAVADVMQSPSPRDIKGISGEKGLLNIFTAKNRLMFNLRTHLDPEKG
ncbi:type I-E CRISPR-associated protein Cse1/CasA [Lactiplantibacillus nangangensis]|uniref:Type I-E CRISPR-associated protein Cse1/CasA n=1 Tax=Lactiplantibacillus nangangensis TaxID=2559917 RepID=A0ABW1SGT7_9LACO|nr:type I-E CRISPR-associated protein Cse1/CasA [Lactiplantibacillus nangangensis]